jgi:hypothetical protein
MAAIVSGKIHDIVSWRPGGIYISPVNTMIRPFYCSAEKIQDVLVKGFSLIKALGPVKRWLPVACRTTVPQIASLDVKTWISRMSAKIRNYVKNGSQATPNYTRRMLHPYKTFMAKGKEPTKLDVAIQAAKVRINNIINEEFNKIRKLKLEETNFVEELNTIEQSVELNEETTDEEEYELCLTEPEVEDQVEQPIAESSIDEEKLALCAEKCNSAEEFKEISWRQISKNHPHLIPAYYRLYEKLQKYPPPSKPDPITLVDTPWLLERSKQARMYQQIKLMKDQQKHLQEMIYHERKVHARQLEQQKHEKEMSDAADRRRIRKSGVRASCCYDSNDGPVLKNIKEL